MRTEDFEKAIGALGVHDLCILKFCYQLNGGVAEVYARMGELTFLKWDSHGRGFVSEQPANEECCISSDTARYLDYRRDADFDLTF